MKDAYKNILVAVDGSEQSEKAFKEAVRIAKNNKAKLYITSIINDAELTTSAYSFEKLFTMEKERVETEVLKKIQDARTEEIANIEPIVDVGSPKRYIADIIPESHEIDLIIIGSTGKGAIQRTLVGSTTSYVVNHAPCNVLVVR